MKNQIKTFTRNKSDLFTSLLESLIKNILLKPSLKILQNRERYPRFWIMPYDTICKKIFTDGLYEKELLFGLSKIGDFSNSVCVDIGANIGNHSLFFSKIFNTVISFEPSQRNVWILKANLELNNIKNVTVIPKGLSDESGYISMGNDENKLDTNNGFAIDAQLSSFKTLDSQVEIAIGDNELEGMELEKRIRLIKIDVEGLEPKVINGLKKTILSHKPIVAWEAFTKETVNQSKIILEDFGMQYFYHLTKDFPNNSKINRILNANKLTCHLIPLEICEKFDGLNIGSFHPLT